MATDLISLRLTESAIFKPGTSKTVERQRRLPCFFLVQKVQKISRETSIQNEIPNLQLSREHKYTKNNNGNKSIE